MAVIGTLVGYAATSNIWDGGGIAPTLVVKGRRLIMVEEKGEYKIRELTPRERLRLMGVSDEDIDKMMEVTSDTQLIKQSGNSIVVDVLAAMFENLHIHNNVS